MELVPYKARTETTLSCLPLLGCGKNLIICESGRKPTPGTELAAIFILDFQPPGRAQNKHLLLLLLFLFGFLRQGLCNLDCPVLAL